MGAHLSLTTGYLKLMIFGIFIGFSAFGSDYHSPRTDGLGGAGHASPVLTDAVYLNPSYSSYSKMRAFSASYLMFNGEQIDTPQGVSNYYGHNFNISVLDGSHDALFQAGVGFTRRDDANLVHIGASHTIIEQLGIGLGSKFIFPNDNSGQRVIDGTASLTGIPTGWFQASLIVDNVFEASKDRGYYREFTLGTKFDIMSIVSVYLDPNWVPTYVGDTKWGFEAGLEFTIMSDFFIRLGMFKSSTVPYQARRADGYAAGIGWMAPRLALDYSFSRTVVPILSNSHNFGFTVYF